MTEAKWVRLAALAGGAATVLIAIAGPILSRSHPAASAPGQTIFDFVSSHRSHLQLSAALAALAMTALMLWLSGLFGALRRAPGGSPALAVAAVAGGVLAGSTGIASAALKAATACQIDSIGAGSVRIFYTLVLATNGGVLLGLTVVIFTTAVATLAGRWFTLLSAILAVGSLVGAMSIAYPAIEGLSSVFLSLDMLWVLAVSILLWRRTALATTN